MKKNNPKTEDNRCDSCGRFGAIEVGNIYLCTDCYQERGSCCMEFGGNDLWKEKYENDENEKANPPESEGNDKLSQVTVFYMNKNSIGFFNQCCSFWRERWICLFQ